jgi:hypothetical protein
VQACRTLKSSSPRPILCPRVDSTNGAIFAVFPTKKKPKAKVVASLAHLSVRTRTFLIDPIMEGAISPGGPPPAAMHLAIGECHGAAEALVYLSQGGSSTISCRWGGNHRMPFVPNAPVPLCRLRRARPRCKFAEVVRLSLEEENNSRFKSLEHTCTWDALRSHSAVLLRSLP